MLLFFYWSAHHCIVTGIHPHQRDVHVTQATRGAHMLFAGDSELRRLLIECGIVYQASTGNWCFSTTQFRSLSVDICYVIVPGPRDGVYFTDNLACTCSVYGLQQQCQHTIFVGGQGAITHSTWKLCSCVCMTF